MIGFVLRKMAASVGGDSERWQMREGGERGREQEVGVGGEGEGDGDAALVPAPPSLGSHR